MTVLIVCAAVFSLLIVFPLIIGFTAGRGKDSVWNKDLLGARPKPAFVPAWFMDLAILLLAIIVLAALVAALMNFFH